MPIRTGKQFLDGLHDDRQIFMEGERIKDVTKRPALCRGGAEPRPSCSTCSTTRRSTTRMTFPSPSSGEPVGLSFIEPRSVDDLVRRRGMVKIWMDRDLRHVRPQPRFPQCDADRARRRRAGIRPHRQALRRQHPQLSRLRARARPLHDAYPPQPAGRPLAPRRAPGEGSRRQDRPRDRCRDRHQGRPHGVDPVRLCRRHPGHALDLSRDQRRGRALCVRLFDPGGDGGAALHLPAERRAPELGLGHGLPAVVAARRGRRAGGFRRCAGAVGARLHPPRPGDVQRAFPAHPSDAAGHAPDLDQEFGEGRVHVGAGLRDRALDQYRRASACPGHAGRTDPACRIRALVYPRQRSRCRGEPAPRG